MSKILKVNIAKTLQLLLLIALVGGLFVFPRYHTKAETSVSSSNYSLDSSMKPTKTANNILKGLELTPFLLDLEVAKGGTISSEIKLTNHSDSSIIVTISVRDFLPGNDGQPEFVPDVQINDPSFSLAQWVQIKHDKQINIKPEETIAVPFNLNPPANAEDGTHYGAILFSYVGRGAVGNASEVQQTIGSIILVKYGVGKEVGKTELKADHSYIFNPGKVLLQNKFTNTGNVHTQPKGEVYVKNIFGKIVGTTFVNRDSANVLPNTSRTFLSTWYPSSFAFGRYTLESVLIYGNTRLEARSSVVVWVLPWYLLVLVGLVMLVILWFIFHGRHWHKRRVIDKHLNNKMQALE